jgi:CheY-like chemotaxis protein
MKVLVADDDVGVRVLVRRILAKEFGVEVVEAVDGVAALSAILGDRIDLLVTDLNMPLMNGLEALESIRASRDHAALPVVVMTGQPGEQDFRRAQDLGISGFVVKPFSAADLRTRLAPIIRPIQEREATGVREQTVLTIEPGHRVLVVDQSPELVAVAEQMLSRICRVEVAPHEFAAIRACLDAPPDALFVGTTSDLISIDALAQKIRGATRLHPLPIVALAAATDMARLKASGLFDAVIVRSFTTDAFETGLRAIVDDASRARLFFHPLSAWLSESFEISDAAVSVHTQRPALESAVRWIASDVEVQGARFGWTIRLRCPLEVALDLAGASAGAASDEVSESTALAAATTLMAAIATEWRDRARTNGLSCETNAPVTVSQNCLGAGPDSDVPFHARRWLTSGRREIAILETIPLVAASHR